MVLVSYSERCEQGARAIAALNHLHICTQLCEFYLTKLG